MSDRVDARLRLVGLLRAALPIGAATGLAQAGDAEAEFRRHARRVVPRDAFPVFDDPEVASADYPEGEVVGAE